MKKKKVEKNAKFKKNVGENTILVLTFWGHGQFGPYILVVINLVHVIFKLESI